MRSWRAKALNLRPWIIRRYTLWRKWNGDQPRYFRYCQKCLLKRWKRKHWYLIVVQKDKSIDMAKLKDTIGSTRLSFAREGLPAGAPGGWTRCGNSTGHPQRWKSYRRSNYGWRHGKKEMIGVHPCDNTSTVFMKYKDLEKLIKDNGNSIRKVRI